MIRYKLVQKYEKTDYRNAERHKDKKTKIRKDNTQNLDELSNICYERKMKR